MKKCESESVYLKEMLAVIDSVLPVRLSREIARLGEARRDFPRALSEIRVRRNARSSVVLSGENIPLFSSVSESEMRELYDGVLGGALYAHADEIRQGFVSMPYGVRVGISTARHGWGDLPSEIASLVFRIPSAPSECADDIYELWKRERPRGMLIFSAPGGGKTSAIRGIARRISRDSLMRVSVVDERRELGAEDFSDAPIDILSGYKKAEGVEIAMRTLSPEVIVIDEIGNEGEAEALLSVGRGGVPIIATAHAEDIGEALARRSVRLLRENGYLDLFIRLRREGGKFSFVREI